MPEQLSMRRSMRKVRLCQYVVYLQSSKANANSAPHNSRRGIDFSLSNATFVLAINKRIINAIINTIAILLMIQFLLNIPLRHTHSQKHLQRHGILFSSEFPSMCISSGISWLIAATKNSKASGVLDPNLDLLSIYSATKSLPQSLPAQPSPLDQIS